MSIAVFGRTELRCSLPVLLLIPAAAVFGMLPPLLAMLASLAAHELAHAFMAHRLGYTVDALEIQPFGFIARLSREPDSGADAAAISAAGPLASLFLALSAAGLVSLAQPLLASLPFMPADGWKDDLLAFSRFNLILGAVNLFPVLPLDGGRLLAAFLEKKTTEAAAKKRLLAFGAAFGLLLCLLGGFLSVRRFTPNTLSFIITGGFIFLAALSERRNAGSDVRRRLHASGRLKSGGALRVTAIALHGDTGVRRALAALPGSGYGVVLVTDDELRTVGRLDEGRLTAAALEGRTDLPLFALLSEKSK